MSVKTALYAGVAVATFAMPAQVFAQTLAEPAPIILADSSAGGASTPQGTDGFVSAITRGTILEADKRYWSESRNHYLIWSWGSNLAIRAADGTVIWSTQLDEKVFRRGGSFAWEASGRLSFRAGTNPPKWTATDRVLDPNMGLVLQANGALQLISPTRGVLWSSDGVLVQPARPAAVPDPAKDGFIASIGPDTNLESARLYWSQSGKHFLTWTRGGNLVIQAADGALVWAAPIRENYYVRTNKLRWHSNGVLTLSNVEGNPMWSAPSDAKGKGGRLFLQDNGSLQIISPEGAVVWSNDGNMTPPSESAPVQMPVAEAVAAPDSVAGMRPGTDLTMGERLWSDDRSHFLTHNPDGNLVVARADGGYVWGFDTALPAGDYQRVARTAWQPDGRLAAYAADGTRIWAAPEGDSDPDARLVLGANGVLEIVSPTRGPLWTSAPGKRATAAPPPDMALARLAPGTDVAPGQKLWTDDGSHFITLNQDGNLVIARADGGYVWGFDTALPAKEYERVARVAWEPNGRLAAYAADGTPIWIAPEVAPDPGSRLALGSDGRLEIVSPARGPLWSSTGILSQPAAATTSAAVQDAAPAEVTPDAGAAIASETAPAADLPVDQPTAEADPAGASPTTPVAPKPPIARDAPLPAATAYTLQPKESRVLPGSLAGTGKEYNCAKSIAPGDQDMIGQLTVAAELFDNGCYTDGQFNQRDFRVDRGVLSSAAGLALDAYTVHPAEKKPSKFLGSHHGIYYKFAESRDQTVYSFDGVSLKKVAEIPAGNIVPGLFTKLGDLDASLLDSATTFVFAASDQAVSPLHKLAEGVEGALIADTALGLWETYRYSLPATPFDTVRDYTAGPNTYQNVYGQTRRFFGVELAGQAGIVWQEGKDKDKIFLTLLGADLRAKQTVELPNTALEKLAAVTHDDKGMIYYLTIQRGGGKEGKTRNLHLYKVDSAGMLIASKALNGGDPKARNASQDAMSVTEFGDFVADMAWSNDRLGLMLGRHVHRSSDGLVHQSGGGFVFNAKTLEMEKNLGQTSGHSFGNVLSVAQDKKFVGIDLGDNFPRGVNLHSFDQNGITSRLVYGVKTQHGDTSANPAGVGFERYSEISTKDRVYYKWSNDNRTYAELGGVTDTGSGLTVVFAGEPDANGDALQNGRTGGYLNDARNIGLVKVPRDFSGSNNPVLSPGKTKTGGFYTFGGTWTKLENKGIVWLTRYTDKAKENASRIKTAALPDGNILILWETWTPDAYVSTHAMKVSTTGEIIGEPVDLGPVVRLARRDDPLIIGNRILFIAGDKVGKELVVTAYQP